MRNAVSAKVKLNSKMSVLHMIKSSSPEFKNFGECYVSEINFNSIKGWKLHSKKTQNISVPSGKIKTEFFLSLILLKSFCIESIDCFLLERSMRTLSVSIKI